MAEFNALMLRAEGEYAILEIEFNGKWAELIRERLDSPFSHIIEPTGIYNKVNNIDDSVIPKNRK